MTYYLYIYFIYSKCIHISMLFRVFGDKMQGKRSSTACCQRQNPTQSSCKGASERINQRRIKSDFENLNLHNVYSFKILFQQSYLSLVFHSSLSKSCNGRCSFLMNTTTKTSSNFLLTRHI